MKATKTLPTSLTQTQVGGSTDSREETCRHLRQARRPTCKQLRHRHRRGTKPSGRRTIGILSILQVLTSADFSHGWDRFRLLGEKSLQPTDGVCEQYSHKHSTYRVAHSIITFHDANTRGSSSRIAHLCVHKTIVIHVSCLTCPCLLLLLSFLGPHRHPQHSWSTMNIWDPVHDHTATISDRVAASCGQSLLQVMSQKIVETNVIDAEAINPEDLEPEELSLTEILGQIRIKSTKDL